MQLLPIRTPELLDVAAAWLADPDTSKWLDFGNGVRILNATMLRIMSQKQVHVLRVFTADDGVRPIGIVGLSNVDRDFASAMIWIVLGERQYSAKGYALRAASKILTLGFRDLALHTVHAWTVACNHASARIIRRLNFRPIGRQRECHYINGNVYDRLWFDLLANEHREIADA